MPTTTRTAIERAVKALRNNGYDYVRVVHTHLGDVIVEPCAPPPEPEEQYPPDSIGWDDV